MSIRLPLTTIGNFANNGLLGANSVSGGIANTFLIPQDTDNIVVKMSASVTGGGVSTILQTSDDGGTTWYDVARTSIVSNANAAYNAEWLSTPVIGIGVRTGIVVPSVVATGSVQSFGSIYGAIGNAPAASSLGMLQVSGLPILGRNCRTFLVVGAGVTTVNSVTTLVYVNSQSGVT